MAVYSVEADTARGEAAQLSSSSAEHFVALDGLRGIAALSVVALHICEYFRLGYSPKHAHLAVDFFFMLSGFVISHAYDRKLSADMGFLRFFRIRMVRLYPMIAAGVALGCGLFIANSLAFGGVRIESVLSAALFALLLIPTSAMLYLRPWAFPLNSPLWSLSSEMAANLAYAAAYRFLSIRILYAIAIVGACAITAASLGDNGLNVGFRWSDFSLGFVRVIYPFTAGVLLRRRFVRSQKLAPYAFLGAPVLLGVLFNPLEAGGLFEALAVLLVFPAVVVLGAQSQKSLRLDNFWRSVGDLSYPLYVTHFPLVVALSNAAKKWEWRTELLAPAAALSFAAVIVFAWACLKFYDQPVRYYLARQV